MFKNCPVLKPGPYTICCCWCSWCTWYWPTLSGITDDLSDFWQNSLEYCQPGWERGERPRDRHCVKLAAINLHRDSEYNKDWYNYGPDRELKIFHIPWWWPNLITVKAKCLIDAADKIQYNSIWFEKFLFQFKFIELFWIYP